MLYLDIHPETFERIMDSPAIHALAGQPRFDIFRHPDTSPEEWHDALDGDFDNRQHLVKTAYLANGICDIERVDGPTTRAVVLTALVHDAAEGVTGDRNYHLKDQADDEEEIDIIDQLVEAGELNVTRSELEIVVGIMRDKHGPKATQAGKLFDLAEIIGYARSGITAWRTAHDASIPIMDAQRHMLRLLPTHVFGGQFAHLRAYAEQGFISPEFFFDTFTDEISAVLAHGNHPDIQAELHEHQMSRGIPETKSREILADLAYIAELWLGRTGLRGVA